MPSIALPHLELEYQEHGDRQGTPVLLLHGFPDSPAGWHALVAAWRGEPVRFIAVSLRGFGGTRITEDAARSGQIAALADDVLALATLLHLERPLLLGHDWGARAAFAAAALQPERVRGLVALASEYVAYGDSGELPHRQERDYWYQWFLHTPQGEASLTRDRAGFGRFLWQTWSPGWQFSEADLAEAAQAWQNPQFVATVLHYYRHRHGNAPGAAPYAAQQAELANKLNIAAPTWFVTGLADACNHSEGSLEQAAWFTGGYRRVELAGIGHFIHREAPEAVAGVLAEALAGTR